MHNSKICFFKLTHIAWLAVRKSAIIETSMTSVERVMEYGKLTLEAPTECSSADKGLSCEKVPLEFKNVSFRYAKDEPTILKNVSFKICQGEKVSWLLFSHSSLYAGSNTKPHIIGWNCWTHWCWKIIADCRHLPSSWARRTNIAQGGANHRDGPA